MNWRGTESAIDRIWASLPYLLPLVDSLMFGYALFRTVPFVEMLFVPLFPLLVLYRGVPFFGLIVFFLLLFLVVRNTNISHFIRFNTMQAILLDIALFICQLLFSLLGFAVSGGLVTETLYNVLFLGAFAAVVYSVAQTLMGRYAEIPTISDAVHMQVR